MKFLTNVITHGYNSCYNYMGSRKSDWYFELKSTEKSHDGQTVFRPGVPRVARGWEV